MEGMGVNSPGNDYTYNGKELNEDFGLNLYDYGARWYDAALGRWWSVDLKAERYMPFSAYNYVLNNPLIFVDPDGTTIIDGEGKPITYSKTEDGKIEWSDNVTDDVKEVGNAMLATESGEKAFNQWQEADTEVSISVDRETEPQDQQLATTTGTKLLNKDGQNKKADVVFYKKQIDKDRQEGADSRFENSSYEETLGAVGIHEAHHNDPEQIKLDRKKKDELKQDPGKNKPINSEVDFRREYHQKKPSQKNEKTWENRYRQRGYKGLKGD